MNTSYKNIAIIVRDNTPQALNEARKLSQWLSDQSFQVFCQPSVELCSKALKINDKKDLDPIDLVVVLGGDGTYLEAVGLLRGRKTPIVGINLGSLGFLTDNRIEELYDTLKATLSHEMESRPRSMLNLSINNGQKEFLALNDIVIERGDRTHLINISIHYDRQLVVKTKSDGVIVSSPTGSTAYNLAAGGPILHPEVRAIVVTPICPHSLTTRPIIFPDDREIQFQILGKEETAKLTVDGKNSMEIHSSHKLIIKRHRQDHFIIRHPTHNFFNLLREKLKFGERD